jgi:hypothetical protein
MDERGSVYIRVHPWPISVLPGVGAWRTRAGYCRNVSQCSELSRRFTAHRWGM